MQEEIPGTEGRLYVGGCTPGDMTVHVWSLVGGEGERGHENAKINVQHSPISPYLIQGLLEP